MKRSLICDVPTMEYEEVLHLLFHLGSIVYLYLVCILNQITTCLYLQIDLCQYKTKMKYQKYIKNV